MTQKAIGEWMKKEERHGGVGVGLFVPPHKFNNAHISIRLDVNHRGKHGLAGKISCTAVLWILSVCVFGCRYLLPQLPGISFLIESPRWCKHSGGARSNVKSMDCKELNDAAETPSVCLGLCLKCLCL